MDLREAASAQGLRHPWEIARCRALERILRRARLPAAARVLDVGCGDGYAGQQLFARCGFGSLVGLDTGLSPEQCAAVAGPVRLVREREALAGERFDLLLLLDVIEHVPDDDGFLRSLVDDFLVPGGLVLITVPAFQILYSQHDVFLEHYRRYSAARLAALVRTVGLEVVRRGSLFGSLLLPRALVSLREQLLGPPRGGTRGLADWSHGVFLQRLVAAALELDNRCMLAAADIAPLPGLSLWTLCAKP